MLSLSQVAVLIGIFSGTFSFLASAQAAVQVKTIQTELLKINAPANGITVYNVLSTIDGRIYTADPQNPSNRDVVRELKRLAKKGNRNAVELTLRIEGEDDEIIGVRELPAVEAQHYEDDLSSYSTKALLEESSGETLKKDDEAAPLLSPASPTSTPAAIAEAERMGYRPTILGSMGEAWNLFREQAPLDHDSQCHERAMRWSYDWWLRHSINSMKVMMFYSQKFQNTYLRVTKGVLWGYNVKPYKWWYHTAPYVYVGDQEVVIDSEFTKGPMTLDEWTHFFLSDFIHEFSTVLKEQNLPRNWQGYLMDGDQRYVWKEVDGRKQYIQLVDRLPKEQTHCSVLTRYQELRHETADWCRVRKLPMYYFQPSTFEAHDCDPRHDNPMSSPDLHLNDGRPKTACFHEVRRSWYQKSVKADLERALGVEIRH